MTAVADAPAAVPALPGDHLLHDRAGRLGDRIGELLGRAGQLSRTAPQSRKAAAMPAPQTASVAMALAIRSASDAHSWAGATSAGLL